MRAEALKMKMSDGFERRLRLGLVAAFVGLAVLLVGLGVWLERPFGGSSAPTVSQSLEVAR